MSNRPPTEREVPARVSEEFIVDTDFHAGPSTDATVLLPYIEDRRIREKLELSPTLSFPSRVSPAYGMGKTEGYHAHGAAMTGEEVVDVLETFGIDVAIATPGTNTLPAVQYPRMKDALVRAVNDYLLDAVVPDHDEIKMHVTLPIWNPEACVEELDRIGSESDVVGAMTWYGPYTPLLGEPQYDAVYERLVALDLPLAIHVGGSSTAEGLVGNSVRTRTESLGLYSSFYGIMDAANMVVTGVFDKFPDLTVVCQEMGVTWLPFVANRMNEIYYTQPEDVKLAERMFDMDAEYLAQDPGTYLYEHFYFSTQPIALPPGKAGAMLDLCAADRTFMYSSDWPHHTLDPVNWVFDGAIDDDTREAILHGNAAECYRL